MSQVMMDRIALITGSSRGIGRAIAVQLAADGLLVIVNHRQSEAAAQQTLAEIIDRGGRGVVRLRVRNQRTEVILTGLKAQAWRRRQKG